MPCLCSAALIHFGQQLGGLTVLLLVGFWADYCPAEPVAVEGCNMMRSLCALPCLQER